MPPILFRCSHPPLRSEAPFGEGALSVEFDCHRHRPSTLHVNESSVPERSAASVSPDSGERRQVSSRPLVREVAVADTTKQDTLDKRRPPDGDSYTSPVHGVGLSAGATFTFECP